MVKKIALAFMFCMLVFGICRAQEPAPFHDTWNIRNYYSGINKYLTTCKISGHHFYDNINGLETHLVTFNKDPENILLIAEQDEKIVQIVITDPKQEQLREKTLATLKLFGGNVSVSDLNEAEKKNAVMISGKDRNFIIRYENNNIPTYILYACK